jgi:chromosome segregation ATPase
MSKVINKIVNKTTGRNKALQQQPQQRSYPGMNRMTSGLELLRRGSTSSGYDNSDITHSDEPLNNITASDESPRSVGGSSAEELFNQHRMKNHGAQKLYVGYDATEESLNSGSSLPQHHNSKGGSTTRSSNDGSRSNGTASRESKSGKHRGVAAFIINEASVHDFSEAPNSTDYVDHEFGSFCDDDNDHKNDKHLTQSSQSKSSQLHNSDYSFSNGSFDDPIQLQQVPMRGGRGDLLRTRSRSAQRSSTIEKFPIDSSDGLLSRRSRSTGRGRVQDNNNNFAAFESANLSATNLDEPKRKSKMEKIFQLQEKNQRYKDEFRKVQKDRKALKIEIEQKRNENATLAKEIDIYLLEISTLKHKLTSTLQTVDRNELNDRKDKSLILKLQKELATVQTDHSIAIGRVTRLREELETMKILLCEKDDKIKTLSEEVAEQLTLVDALHIEIMELKQHQSIASNVEEMKVENDRLQTELGETLERASSMVKEREEAIADLLKDNDDLKRMLTEAEAAAAVAREEAVAATMRTQRETDDNDRNIEEERNQITSALEEITQLREELSLSAAALEEAQDRNVLLEEDVEAWIVKKEEMEGEIQRLHDEVEAWKTKAAAVERSMNVVESTAKESAKQVAALETALREAEFQYSEHLQEQERRHTEALLDQKEKITQQMALAHDTVAPQNPQELMLQKAVADRKAKDAATKGSGIWNSVIQRVQTAGSTEVDDKELTTEQRRIKELETINADQNDEINKQKSEMVKLKATYNDTLYNNKKKIESLEDDKEMYMAKQQAMEFELNELRRELDQLRESSSGSTVASF